MKKITKVLLVLMMLTLTACTGDRTKITSTEDTNGANIYTINCPLKKLKMERYHYIDGTWTKVRNHTYDATSIDHTFAVKYSVEGTQTIFNSKPATEKEYGEKVYDNAKVYNDVQVIYTDSVKARYLEPITLCMIAYNDDANVDVLGDIDLKNWTIDDPINAEEAYIVTITLIKK